MAFLLQIPRHFRHILIENKGDPKRLQILALLTAAVLQSVQIGAICGPQSINIPHFQRFDFGAFPYPGRRFALAWAGMLADFQS